MSLSEHACSDARFRYGELVENRRGVDFAICLSATNGITTWTRAFRSDKLFTGDEVGPADALVNCRQHARQKKSHCVRGKEEPTNTFICFADLLNRHQTARIPSSRMPRRIGST